MREKIILQDFNVLLICTSKKWSTVERRAISDAIFLRNSGSNPTMLCLKNSQVDKEADKEDIPRIYITPKKIPLLFMFDSYFDFKRILNQGDCDIVHTYSIKHIWPLSLILKSNIKTPLLCTHNEHIKDSHFNIFSRWLLRRVDHILTLSDEIKDLTRETFLINPKKVLNLGSGIDTVRSTREVVDKKIIGCVINNINELHKLKSVVKTFRVLKSHHNGDLGQLMLSIFLGPRVYQKDKAKRVLTELDYEFYEGDILLYSLESKAQELKNLDVFLSLAFDEPLNDFEIMALMNETPVLFPRSATRQDLLFKYRWIGESYYAQDTREAKTKLEKILTNYSIYRSALKDYFEEITEGHGIDRYADKFQQIYVRTAAKRQRLVAKKTTRSSLT